MSKNIIDFYSKTSLKSYNLNEAARYQLGLLDNLDVFTRQHCENVATIVCRLCEYMHMNKDFTVYCTICAYLHDIGKLFIPPEILQKPGRLTPDEYEIMKSHTTLGYNMCMQDPKLRPFASGAIYHHEALNGTGYPKALFEKDIPIEGQIIRVADEYDAIVSKRQYKSHVGITDTLKILIKDTQPDIPKVLPSDMPKSVALKTLKENAGMGKISARVVKNLFKVVINDIEYEISCIFEYLKYLNTNIKRLETIHKYNVKRVNSKSENDKLYYEEGMKLLFDKGEDLRNYQYVLEEYRTAYVKRKEIIDNLYSEIKAIKKLKI